MLPKPYIFRNIQKLVFTTAEFKVGRYERASDAPREWSTFGDQFWTPQTSLFGEAERNVTAAGRDVATRNAST